jgi:hypothetical protein
VLDLQHDAFAVQAATRFYIASLAAGFGAHKADGGDDREF